MNSNIMPKLSADQPEFDPTKDAFQYAPFAKQLARSICLATPSEGLVLGVYAPWGSGKSTLLNFVEHYIAECEEQSRPLVIRFNPWWFSGDEALVRHFFDTLKEALPDDLTGKTEIKDRLTSLAEAVSANPLAKVAKIGGVSLGEAAGAVATQLKGGDKNIVALKQELSKLLRMSGRTVVIIIDDVDRLVAEEIRQLFRVIKAVADFPGVFYVLAFDKHVVTSALESFAEGRAGAYLEKIVQVPFELPSPSQEALGRFLIAKVNEVTPEVDPSTVDQDRFTALFFEGMRKLITTPRDVVRLTNSLTLTLPAVIDEVDLVDFFGMELLRVFAPDVFHAICAEPEHFVGQPPSREYGERTDVAYHAAVFAAVDESKRGAVRKVVELLFPRVATHYYTGYAGSWRRERRVASSDAFPMYARLAIADTSVSKREANALISLMADRQAFTAELERIAAIPSVGGVPRIRTVLNRLEDFTESDIPADVLPTLILSLLDATDAIERVDSDTAGLFEFGAGIYIGRLIWQALERLSRAERMGVLLQGVKHSKSLQSIVHRLIVLGQQHDPSDRTPRPEEDWLVSVEQLRELEQATVRRIRLESRKGEFLELDGLSTILYCWSKWGTAQAVRSWGGRAIKKPEEAVLYVSNYLGHSKSQGMGSYTVHRNASMNLVSVEIAVPLKRLEPLLLKADTSKMTAWQKEATAQFFIECNKPPESQPASERSQLGS